MAGEFVMLRLVNTYIRQKQATGLRWEKAATELRAFAKYLEINDFSHISYSSVMIWLEFRSTKLSKPGLDSIYALIRSFSIWVHNFDSSHEELPYRKLKKKRRRQPVILDTHMVASFMENLRKHPCERGLTSYTNSIMMGLMFTTGMRIGEAHSLLDSEVKVEAGYVYIKPSKSNRDRMVPLTESTIGALVKYREYRSYFFPSHKGRFFMFDNGEPKCQFAFVSRFNKVANQLGYRPDNQHGYKPTSLKPHDIRHSFAVGALIKCYKEQRNVQEEVSKLTVVLGHKHVKETYWYIEAVPELLELAMTAGSQ